MNPTRFFKLNLPAIVLLFLLHGPTASGAILNVPSPDFPTIQAAVNSAASGDTIAIAPGEYREQILIQSKTNLTLRGAALPDNPSPAAHTVIRPPGTMLQTLPRFDHIYYPLIAISKAHVVLEQLTIQGDNRAEEYPGLVGPFFLGSNGRVEHCVLSGFRGETMSGRANAVHLLNPESLQTDIVELVIRNNIFRDNKLAMHLRGNTTRSTSTRSRFLVEGNSIVGPGPAFTAFDGIIIRTAVTGTVRLNLITQYSFTGFPGSNFSSGISAFDGEYSNGNFLPLRPIVIEENIFIANDNHVLLVSADQCQILNNIFHQTGANGPHWGALAVSGSNILIENNNFSSMPTGIVLFGNEEFFSWPPVGIASGTTLRANWFTNVTLSIQTNQPLPGLQEIGTQLCCFNPVFQSTTQPYTGTIRTTVRSWHGQSLVIESSTNLRDWTPIQTNHITLPLSDFEYAFDPSTPHLFVRTVVIGN